MSFFGETLLLEDAHYLFPVEVAETSSFIFAPLFTLYFLCAVHCLWFVCIVVRFLLFRYLARKYIIKIFFFVFFGELRFINGLLVFRWLLNTKSLSVLTVRAGRAFWMV